MADRTSAALFGQIFRYLAEGEPDERAKTFAKNLMKQTREFDFCTYQMGCGDALKKLGLPDEDADV